MYPTIKFLYVIKNLLSILIRKQTFSLTRQIYFPGIRIIHSQKVSKFIVMIEYLKRCWTQDSHQYLAAAGLITTYSCLVRWEHLLTLPQKKIKDARNAFQVSNFGFLDFWPAKDNKGITN